MASAPRFLDTNIVLRLLTRDDEAKAQRALHLLLRVERGEERVLMSSLVVFEVVFTLQSFYRVPRARITELLVPLLRLRGIDLAEKPTFVRALTLYTEMPSLSFADVYSVAVMEARGISDIYTWDTDFDRVPGIRRVEPDLPPIDYP